MSAAFRAKADQLRNRMREMPGMTVVERGESAHEVGRKLLREARGLTGCCGDYRMVDGRCQSCRENVGPEELVEEDVGTLFDGESRHWSRNEEAES